MRRVDGDGGGGDRLGPPTHRRNGAIVTIAVSVLIVGAIATGIGIAGRSVDSTIGGRSAADAVATRLAADPAVQARVRDGVVTALISKVPILEGFRSSLEGIVGSMVQQPRFRAVLELAIRRSIAELLDGRSSQVTISLDDVRGPLVSALGGSVVAGLLPPPGSAARIVVLDVSQVKHLRQVRSTGVRASAVLLGVGIALLGVGIVLARRWRLVAVGVGATSLAIVAALVPHVADRFRGRATDSIADPIGRAAARAVWDVTIHDLSGRMEGVALIAATIALGAFAGAAVRRVRSRRGYGEPAFGP